MSVIHRPKKEGSSSSGDRGSRSPSKSSNSSSTRPRTSSRYPSHSSSSSSSAASPSAPSSSRGSSLPEKKGTGAASGLKMLPADRKRSVLVKRNGKTDPAYGTPPLERSLETHLRLGAINLDKTSGPTSHEVVAWVKRILEVERQGIAALSIPR